MSLCEAELREGSLHDEYSLENTEEEEEWEGRCRHITIHPDTLMTTAIVDHLVPCTQYLVRWRVVHIKSFHHPDYKIKQFRGRIEKLCEVSDTLNHLANPSPY